MKTLLTTLVVLVSLMSFGCAATREYHTAAKIVVDQPSANWQKEIGPSIRLEYSITR